MMNKKKFIQEMMTKLTAYRLEEDRLHKLAEDAHEQSAMMKGAALGLSWDARTSKQPIRDRDAFRSRDPDDGESGFARCRGYGGYGVRFVVHAPSIARRWRMKQAPPTCQLATPDHAPGHPVTD